MTDATPTPFHDLAAFTALPRCAGLIVSPDGRRLVTAVATPDADGTRYRTALWEVDPAGVRPARRLTRGDPGEHDAAFTPAGDLLFLSARPVPGGTDDDPPPALWTLPAGGGEARGDRHPARWAGRAGRRPGRGNGRLARRRRCPAPSPPTTTRRRRAARKDAKVTAILHEGTPVRFWDHDLGPDRPRLLAACPITAERRRDCRSGSTSPRPRRRARAGGVRRHPGRVDGARDLAGRRAARRVAAGAGRAGRPGRQERRTALLDDPGHTVDGPVAVSPDGRWVACLRTRRTSAIEPPDVRCVVVPVDGGEARDIAPGWDRWVTDARVDARLRGPRRDRRRHRPRAAAPRRPRHRDRRPAHRRRRRLHRPGGRAGRRRVRAAQRRRRPARPGPARSRGPGAPIPTPLPPPAPAPPLPGTLTEVTATAADGTALRAWLVLPDGASADAPAPLLLWVHGGPLSSWNGWHWRWNPWVMAAHGYAVLLPDPALSTGYGRAFVTRGWGRWGAEPYTDVLALTDAAERLPEIDAGAHRRDGRLVRRLPGQLGRRAHRPLHRRRDAREPVGARPVRPHYRRPGLLAPRAHPAGAGRVQPAPARRRDPHADAGDPRRPRPPGADRRGAAAVVRSDGPLLRPGARTSSCTSPTRTTGCCGRHTPGSGTPPCWPSSTTTCTGPTGWSRICCAEAVVRPPEPG